jgi:hypothetical protein
MVAVESGEGVIGRECKRWEGRGGNWEGWHAIGAKGEECDEGWRGGGAVYITGNYARIVSMTRLSHDLDRKMKGRSAMAYRPQEAQRRPCAPFNLRAFSMRVSSLFRSFSQAFFQRVQGRPVVCACDWRAAKPDPSGAMGNRARSESPLAAVPPTSVITRRRPLFAGLASLPRYPVLPENRHCLFWCVNVEGRCGRGRLSRNNQRWGNYVGSRLPPRKQFVQQAVEGAPRLRMNDDRRLCSLLPVRRACLLACLPSGCHDNDPAGLAV